MKKHLFLPVLFLPILPKTHKPEERIDHQQQSEQDPVRAIQLDWKVFPKDNDQPEHQVEAEHEQPQNGQKPLGGRFLSAIIAFIVVLHASIAAG